MSPVEFLVLANTVSDKYIEAQDILKTINDQIIHWNTTPGTVYPILHRLTEFQLLDQNKENKMQFKISNKGITFLVSTIRAFEENYESTASYFTSILEALIKIDPLQSAELLNNFQNKAKLFTSKLHELETKAKDTSENEEWTEIDIEL